MIMLKRQLIHRLNILIVLCLTLISCSTPKKSLEATNQITAKYDVVMRKNLKNIQPDERIQFIFKCKNKVSPIERKNLSDTGVTINSEIGTILTAEGTKEQIAKLAALDFVIRLEGPTPVKLREDNSQHK